MNIQFLGAARTVTGSMHLVQVNGKNVLLDCGLYQGRRAETYERNLTFPFDPRTIDAVVLSHAHTDHAGNLPNLVKQGFGGRIFCTSATADLCRLMLTDSAHIQERDAEFISKRHKKQHKPPVKPLYTMQDVAPTLALLSEVQYEASFDVVEGVSAMFFDAGHILGSASIRLTIREAGALERHLGFSGDVGRPVMPILRSPAFMGDVDALICESTYGGRVHDGLNTMTDKFLEVIRRTADRGGKIIVPSFSVGRTQDIVYKLNNLRNEGSLPDIPVYVDSPLSTNATAIFRKHPECFDKATQDVLKRDDDIFGFDRLTYIRDVEESKRLNDHKGACMIIAASGMCEAGRVVHHLFNSIEDPKNTVMIVGYQAAHTLGRRIVERNPEVSIFGEVKQLRCDVAVMNAFSAHADKNELLDFTKRFNRDRLKNVFLVHGDVDQAEAFKAALEASGVRKVEIPERLTSFDWKH